MEGISLKLYQLKRECEHAKHTLSSSGRANIEIDSLYKGISPGWCKCWYSVIVGSPDYSSPPSPSPWLLCHWHCHVCYGTPSPPHPVARRWASCPRTTVRVIAILHTEYVSLWTPLHNLQKICLLLKLGAIHKLETLSIASDGR